jgi:hypothetical protein
MKKHSMKEIVFDSFTNKKPIQYRYLSKPLPITKIEQKLKNYFKKGQGKMIQNLDLNFALLEIMIENTLKKHSSFILFELPFSPIVKRKFKNYLPLYQKKLRTLLNKYPQITFVSISEVKKNPPQKLFYDTMHLLPEGRTYFYEDAVILLKKAIHDQ